MMPELASHCLMWRTRVRICTLIDRIDFRICVWIQGSLAVVVYYRTILFCFSFYIVGGFFRIIMIFHKYDACCTAYNNRRSQYCNDCFHVIHLLFFEQVQRVLVLQTAKVTPPPPLAFQRGGGLGQIPCDTNLVSFFYINLSKCKDKYQF